MALASTVIGSPNRPIDRNAETNTAKPVAPRSRPNHDTEMLLLGLAVDPSALAEPPPGAPANEERTPGAVVMSRNRSFVTPLSSRAGMTPFAKQAIAFSVTLLVIAVIAVPVVWKVKVEYGARDEAPAATPAARPPAATSAPMPVMTATATDSVTAATPLVSASAAAPPAVTMTAPPPKARPVAKPKIDPSDPSTVPMD
jgi:hypothetical protein